MAQYKKPIILVALDVIVGLLADPLTFQNPPDFFKASRDVALREADLTQTDDIGELRTALFKQNNRLAESKMSLKKADLVDDVLSCMHSMIGMQIFCGHH